MSMLSGKVALVAGGTGTLGSSIATRLVWENCIVFATYRAESKLNDLRRSLEPAIVWVESDVTDQEEVKRLFDQILATSARIDIVVNCVGGYLGGKPLADVTLSEWNLMLNMNLTSAFLLTRDAVRRMLSQDFGRIIHISAMTGLKPAPNKIPYSIFKAATVLLTELVASEVQGSGVTINAIAPSVIDTPANRASMPDEDPRDWVSPRSIADLVCHLCSPEGGATTGNVVPLPAGV